MLGGSFWHVTRSLKGHKNKLLKTCNSLNVSYKGKQTASDTKDYIVSYMLYGV